MLKKRKYAKWAKEEDHEKVDLKEVEKPKPALKKVERVCIDVMVIFSNYYSFILLSSAQSSVLNDCLNLSFISCHYYVEIFEKYLRTRKSIY